MAVDLTRGSEEKAWFGHNFRKWQRQSTLPNAESWMFLASESLSTIASKTLPLSMYTLIFDGVFVGCINVPTPRHPRALYSGESSTFHTDPTTSLQLHQDIISNLLCWTCCLLTDRAFLINHIFVPCSMKYFRTKKRGHHY